MTASVTTLICGSIPRMGAFTVEVLLGLFLRDRSQTDIAFEFRAALIDVLDDMNKIAAEGVFVNLILDLLYFSRSELCFQGEYGSPKKMFRGSRQA